MCESLGSPTGSTKKGAGARRLLPDLTAPGLLTTTCNGRQKMPHPSTARVCDACAVAGPRRDKHSDPVSRSLQPASFVMPASQLAARHEATQARRTTSASLKTDGPFWAFFGCRRASPEREAEEGLREAGRQASSPVQIAIRYRFDYSPACSGSWRDRLYCGCGVVVPTST